MLASHGFLQFDLQVDEFGPPLGAVIDQPVRKDEARRIVRAVLHDAANECSGLTLWQLD